ncbi:TetR/AcrR family transcriptional regulator [Cryptosporangium sp. NPDC048952]|uniref:TetR/AcrR family transcriptional regulator n=1 Tax=Cryptosporangium sp. NPDC048952 TaxID=3363961 RepID=UPI003723DC35
MGNREDLLDSAKRCLETKGYARTTARDIAGGAGVSLAAIGYHYGTKEALLQAALVQALDEWGQELARSLASSSASGFAETWDRVIESFAANRALWAVQFELLAQRDLPPEVRELFAGAHREARLGLVELFGGASEGAPAQVGALYQALLGGLAAIWLADPAGTPSGADLLAAMRAVVG